MVSTPCGKSAFNRVNGRPARAKRLVAGAERLDAQTLYDWGILDHPADDKDLVTKTMEVAKKYASKPPLAVQMIKQSTNRLVMPWAAHNAYG